MKRNYIILGFIVLLALGGSIIWFTNKLDDTSNNNINNEQEFDPDAWKRVEEKIGIIEGENGWYYQWLISHLDGEAEDSANNFLIGCNLKYSRYADIPGYEDVDNPDDFPTLTHSQKSTNGITESEESDIIDDFFDERQFGRAIDINDLDGLDLYNFDKEFIVDLFNKAYNSEYDKTITKSYLSDLIEEGSATNEQKEIYDNFKRIADYIVENQEVNIRDVFDLSDDVYIRLYNIIEKFDDPYE